MLPSNKNDFQLPVFIVHWNRPVECLNTIKSLLEQDISLKISILDNASSPENLKLLQEQLPKDIELICLEENQGWGGGFNVLLKHWLQDKLSPYCIISAHDTLLQRDCLKQLARCMEDNPKIGIACPEYGIPEIPKYSPIRGPYIVPTSPRTPGTIESVDFAYATLSIFRKQCIQEIGLFDERFFAYGDEYDISLKARKHNWEVAIVWGASVVNPGSWTPKKVLSYLFARNTLLLALNYGGPLQASVRAILMLINTLRITISFNSEKLMFYPLARMLGIGDFFQKCYGKPPF